MAKQRKGEYRYITLVQLDYIIQLLERSDLPEDKDFLLHMRKLAQDNTPLAKVKVHD